MAEITQRAPSADEIKQYGPRVDGTMKAQGFFGEVAFKGAKQFSTELSSSGNLTGKDGKPVLYPLIHQNITREELEHLLSGKTPTDEMYDRAEAAAAARLKEGKSPFAGGGDVARKVPESEHEAAFQAGLKGK